MDHGQAGGIGQVAASGCLAHCVLAVDHGQAGGVGQVAASGCLAQRPGSGSWALGRLVVLDRYSTTWSWSQKVTVSVA